MWWKSPAGARPLLAHDWISLTPPHMCSFPKIAISASSPGLTACRWPEHIMLLLRDPDSSITPTWQLACYQMHQLP